MASHRKQLRRFLPLVAKLSRGGMDSSFPILEYAAPEGGSIPSCFKVFNALVEMFT